MSHPLPSVRLLLKIARQLTSHARRDLGDIPNLSIQYRDSDPVVLNIRIPRKLYQEWKKHENAPLDGNIEDITNAMEIAENEMLAWAELCENEYMALKRQKRSEEDEDEATG